MQECAGPGRGHSEGRALMQGNSPGSPSWLHHPQRGSPAAGASCEGHAGERLASQAPCWAPPEASSITLQLARGKQSAPHPARLHPPTPPWSSGGLELPLCLGSVWLLEPGREPGDWRDMPLSLRKGSWDTEASKREAPCSFQEDLGQPEDQELGKQRCGCPARLGPPCVRSPRAAAVAIAVLAFQGNRSR